MSEKKDDLPGPLAMLQVIHRLEVGPIKLERRRLIVPYTVWQNDKSESCDLIYRYEEDVFDPEEYASQNLAAIIAAQVAINYGLFCHEIIFHGVYDKEDRQFIHDMMRNTAREIYVIKFLQPNPFLQGQATALPLIKSKNYVAAHISFAERLRDKTERHKLSKDDDPWPVSKDQIAVLSSGGKDSLLSFGLLDEIGQRVHPIFVNESGRHWFTALNSYRSFKQDYPQTARVWSNCDRLFSWMIRHLPFVRQDFARMRSDEYPVRLWTVAVFLFGALPILRQRRIARLVIGDEFDTTLRQSYQGIIHYSGLYDQSRYFDNRLTRYFMRKGWSISQFSILRPLSELLIEKILSERYPELQRQQLSCHAAHMENDRVYPCGRCEKCRRIVGMLKAIGVDPTGCGYKQEQVTECLKILVSKGVHQETVGFQHMLYLLAQKGLIEANASEPPGRENPEVVKMRFDRDKSPVDAIPNDLRQPLYRIYLEHSQGAVERQGKLWVECDPSNQPLFAAPYPFELPQDSSMTAQQPGALPDNYLLGELTWPQAQQRFLEVDIALLPVGAIEQHGPHLPLDTDAFDADYLAIQVAQACKDPKPFVLPLIPYGVSYHHDDFKGTVSINNDTLSRLVYDIGMSIARNGITKLVIINGHGGNTSSLNFAAQMINRDSRIFVCVDSGETSDADIDALIKTKNDVHAGEIETSTALAVRAHLVRLSQAQKFVPHFSSHYLDFSSKKSVEWYARTAKISSSGVLGDPTQANLEKGKKIWQIMIRNLVELVETLKSLSLDEIYQRRY